MNYDIATDKASIEAELLTWMAVHGNICLALRHPDNNSTLVRPRMVQLINTIGVLLVDSGFMRPRRSWTMRPRYEAAQGNDITK